MSGTDLCRGRMPCGTGCSSTFCWDRCSGSSAGRNSKAGEHSRSTGRPSWPAITCAVARLVLPPLLVPRRMTFLAKSEYFTEKGLKGALQELVLHRGRARSRSTAAAPMPARAALDTGIRLLTQGKLLGIYPEGTRSPDGRLYKGKTGVARMALEAGVPVVPVAMIGTDKVNPIGSKMWRPPNHHDASASRWTSPGTRAWPATGSSSGRDRRDHVRADGAVRPGVRRRVRGQGQGAEARRPRRRAEGRGPGTGPGCRAPRPADRPRPRGQLAGAPA